MKDASHQWDPVSKRKVAVDSSVWDQSSSSQEVLKAYCEACWKCWGRNVKPGCKYELSSSCEKLAIQRQVKYVFRREKDGNPFQCTLCGRFFNHGSLEGHLQLCRSTQQNPNDAAGNSFMNAAPVPPVIYVPAFDDFNDGATSDIICGTYAASEWYNGKPLYRKMRQEGAELPEVVIFYSHFSWFFADSPSVPLHFYAQNPSDSGPDRVPLPLLGWKVVHDSTLTIVVVSSPGQSLSTERQGSAVEVVWEFLASGDGCPEDWQPMSQDMQEELQKRWADGWVGENGSDTFEVKTRNATYGVNCAEMVQWNTRTLRRRPIRREHRLTAAVLPQLLSRQQSLQSKIDSHLAEKSLLEARVAELERENGMLKSCRAEFATQLVMQEPWRMGRQLDMGVRVEA